MTQMLVLLLQSTALLSLGLLVLRLTRRFRPSIQSLIGRASLAGVAFLLLLAPLTGHVRPVVRVELPQKVQEPTPSRPSLTLPKREGEEAPPPQFWGATQKKETRKEEIRIGERQEGAASSAPAMPALVIPAPRPPSQGGPLRSKEVGFLCAAVSLALLLWLGICQFHLMRLRHTAAAVTSSPATALLAELTPHPPALLTHPSVHSPFLAGIRRPAIFLPPAFAADFNPDALRAVFVHELAHLARRDNQWTLAARLLSALLWFQPLLWLLGRRLEQISEDACDEAVLASHCPPRAYAACLLSLAERPPLARSQRTLTAGVAPFRSSVGRRISRILTLGVPTMPALTLRLRLSVAALTLAAALGGAFLVSSAPAQTQPKPTPVATPELIKFHAEQQQDITNLKVISLALVMYERDDHYRFPDADHWMDQLIPYLDQIASYRRDRSVFFDPFQPGKKHYGYAFNRNFSGKSLAVVRYPAQTVEIFDSTLGTRDASDTGQSLRVNPSASSQINTSGTGYAFADGHSKWLLRGFNPPFALDGGEPTTALSGSQTKVKPDELVIYAKGNVRVHGVLNNGTTVRQASAALDQQIGQAQFLAGLTPVQGPGVVVTLRDSKKPFAFPKGIPAGMALPNIIHDTDINQVVNELRAAGAEAIAVNNQRLVATSAVRCAGPTVYVNNTPQEPPYVVQAIGNPKTLAGTLNIPGGIAAQITAYDKAMFTVQQATTLTLPAYAGGSKPHYAKLVSAGGAQAPDASSLQKRTIQISFQTPKNGVHTIQLFVKDAAGKRLAWSKVYQQRTEVNLPVTAAGPSVSFQIYDNGKLTKEQQIADATAPSGGQSPVQAQKGFLQFRDKTQAELNADKKSLDQYEQGFQAELHQALPEADAATLTKASNLESGLGGLISSRQFIQQEVTHYVEEHKHYASPSIAKKYAQANQRHLDLIKVRQAQIRPLLAEEARLFPATAASQQHLYQVHVCAIKAHEAEIHVSVDTAQLRAINYSLKNYDLKRHG